ncbi:MAG: monovalent cation/H+ antiporter subunit D family protein, partial [Candidatus Competibacter sp.]|nr:monovalent cation/H+ antiporter subunit D family protein [Candidatus Competibacter sp.]
LLCLTGLLGITITGDAFNLFVFLEISSLSSYVLIGIGRDRRALTAAYQYLIMGTIGATFILIGIGLLYVLTGTLNMGDLASRIPAVADTRTVHAAFAFLTVGVSLKLALFPLHLWLPNAYAYAPSAVTAFLAATATKVAIYVLLRFFFTVFGAEFSFETMRLDFVLLPLALVGIFSASVVAIFQTNVKRMLAYSSVAQIGYMILGISLVSVTGLTASISHLFNHALMKGALFMALGCVSFRVGAARLERMAGVGRAMPWTMGAFVIGGLSLIGVPLTAGFVGKWYLIVGALEKGWWPVAMLVLITSLLAVIYIWRVVEVAYFKPAPEGQVVREAPLALLIPTWTLALANLYFGLDTSLNAGVARRAAEMLLGGGGP